MMHSVIILVDGVYRNTYDDWHLIPSSVPVISPPIERTKFVTVPGRNGVLDYSQSIAHRPTYDNRTGKLEFYLETNTKDWDWETAYTTICEALRGKRVQLALEDNPAHYYEGLLWVNQYKSNKSFGTITLEYNLHPVMQTKELTGLVLSQTDVNLAWGAGFQLLVGVTPADTFYRKVNIKVRPRGVVSLLQNGVVMGIGEGKAAITVTCGKQKAVCNVTVVNTQFHEVKRILLDCTESNPVTAVTHGAAYENVISMDEKIQNGVLTVTVKAGEEDITKDCVTLEGTGRHAKIRIASVTSKIVIRASVEEEKTETAAMQSAAAEYVLHTTVDGQFRF